MSHIEVTRQDLIEVIAYHTETVSMFDRMEQQSRQADQMIIETNRQEVDSLFNNDGYINVAEY